jgi:uncharacterized membrane protein
MLGNTGNTRSSSGVRYLLLGSLTLNLAFAGAAGAMAVEHASATRTVPLQPVVGIKHGIDHRFDRIEASLPANDAKIMRAGFRAEAVQLATAETRVRLSEAAVRDQLRAQPFDPAAVRTAMAESGAARDRFHQLVQEIIASTTAKMSPTGRAALADWPERNRKAVITQ